jgi:cyclomaltodextrinase / maltogenic alpha-amylase / neopullulanase
MKLGKYYHYKGKYYEVLGVAKHSETLEDYVYYKCLHKNSTSMTWVRPLKMFQEKVTLPNGKIVKRFKYVGKE